MANAEEITTGLRPRRAAWLASLILAAFASGQAEPTAPGSPAQQESTVVIVHDLRADAAHKALLASLERAIAREPRLRSLQQLGVTPRVQNDGSVRTDPPRATLASYASRADHVVCIGEHALRPFLIGPPLENGATRIHALGVGGLQWLPADNEHLPRLHRVDATIDDQPCIAGTLRLAANRLRGIRRVGIIVSDSCREAPMDLLRTTAAELDLELMVESIADPTEALAAAARLSARRIDLLLQPSDPRVFAGPRGRLVSPHVRVHMVSRSIAVMGITADEHAHFYAPLDPERAAAELLDTILAPRDRDAPLRRCTAPSEILVDAHACAVDRIPLR